MKSVLLFVLAICVPVLAQTTRPVPAITHAVVISVDGMRPDLMLRGDTPNLHKLMAGGTYTMWAKTTEVSITLPSHTSMLTGVPPEVHGLTFNDDGPADGVHPKVPSIFDLAHNAGYTTAMATTKSKLALIAQHADSVTYNAAPPRGKGSSDDSAADAAVRIIMQNKPNLLFLHLGNNDGVGHAKGWGSPEQMQTLHGADQCVGRVVEAVEKAGLKDSTMILVTADHGGRQRWHGPNDPRARHIPWIVSGPGIRVGFDLDRILEKQVNTEDTFATVCTMLAIPIEGDVTGKMVWSILEQPAIAPATVPATAAAAAAGKWAVQMQRI